MKQLALTQLPWPVIALIPLVLFFTFFVCVLVWVSLSANKERFGQMSRLPLEGEEHE